MDLNGSPICFNEEKRIKKFRVKLSIDEISFRTHTFKILSVSENFHTFSNFGLYLHFTFS